MMQKCTLAVVQSAVCSPFGKTQGAVCRAVVFSVVVVGSVVRSVECVASCNEREMQLMNESIKYPPSNGWIRSFKGPVMASLLFEMINCPTRKWR